MKDILQDIVSHTHGLGFLSNLKVSTDSNETNINSVTDCRSVVLYATTHERVKEFEGVFGMGDLDKLNLHLKNPEYKEDAKITVERLSKDDEEFPAHIHFENVIGDFQNDYRFVNKAIIENKIKNVKFKGANWDLEFEPPVASITRMKLMSAAHSEEPNFQVRTESNNLIFSFGDTATHAGEFVFKHNVEGSLNSRMSFPLVHVQSILSLSGESTMSLSNQGVMKISVDSGLATYDYILPCQVK